MTYQQYSYNSYSNTSSYPSYTVTSPASPYTPSSQYSSSSAMSYSGSQQSNSSYGSSYGSTPPSATISPHQMHYRDPFAVYEEKPISQNARTNTGSSGSRSQSVKKSEKSFPCMIQGCASAAKGSKFTRAADLDRHMKTVHFPIYKDCPHGWCGRTGRHGFTRDDHLNEHFGQMHAGQSYPLSKARTSR